VVKSGLIVNTIAFLLTESVATTTAEDRTVLTTRISVAKNSIGRTPVSGAVAGVAELYKNQVKVLTDPLTVPKTPKTIFEPTRVQSILSGLFKEIPVPRSTLKFLSRVVNSL
jgi:hypothetical protein